MKWVEEFQAVNFDEVEKKLLINYRKMTKDS